MDYAALKNIIPENLNEVCTIQTAGSKPSGKVAIGFGLAEKVGEEALKIATGRALLVTDKTISGLGLHSVVEKSLTDANIEVDIYDKVEPEPHIETARELQQIVRDGDYGLVVGLGGGSTLDMTKVAYAAKANPEDILVYLQGKPLANEGLPSILLPTTSGTGSEVSPYIVTSSEGKKLFVGSSCFYPTVALVDPLLTATMPPKVTAATGLDALSHAVEGYTARPTPFSDAMATKAVEYTFNYLEKACRDGNDLEARFYMSYASVMGMMAYIQGGGLYAHSCSYILTLYNNTPHGLGCGVALPHTLMFNLDYIGETLARYARAVDPDLHGSTGELAAKMVEKFFNLLVRVGAPSSLQELGVPEDMIPVFAKEFMEKYYRTRNPRKLDEKEALKFVSLMWEGKMERF